MLIVGEWQLFDDGVTRPIVSAKVLGGDGTLIADDFLIDTQSAHGLRTFPGPWNFDR